MLSKPGAHGAPPARDGVADGRLRRIATAWGVAAAFSVALLLLLLNLCWQAYTQALSTARSEATYVATVLGEHVGRSLSEVMLLLDTVRQDVQLVRRLPYAVPQDNLQFMLDEKFFRLAQLEAIAVFDAGGQPILMAGEWPEPIDTVPTRPYFDQLAGDAARDVVVGRPIKGHEDGLWRLTVSLKLTSASGEFDGVAVAILDPAFYRRVFAENRSAQHVELSFMQTGSIVLARADRSNRTDEVSSAQSGSISPDLMAGESGIFHVRPEGQAGEWLVSYTRLPLGSIVVGAGRPREAILVGILAQRNWSFTITVGIIGLLMLAVWYTAWQISRRLTAEIAARRAEVRLSDGVESLSEGFAMFDAQDRLVTHNARYRELYGDIADIIRPGAARRDIVRAWAERGVFVVPEDEGIEGWVEQRLRESLQPHGISEHRLTSDRWVLISEHRTREGGTVAVHADITDLKWREAELVRLSEELQTQNLRFDTALTNMVQGLCMFDSEQRLIVCNSRYLEMYGFSAEVVKPGISLPEIMEYSISLGNYSREEAERALAERPSQAAMREQAVLLQHLKDGRVIAVMHQPMPNGGSVATYEDITEQKRREASLEIAKEAAEQASQAKSEFLAMISHELRTPLNAIIGFAEMIKTQAFGPLGNDRYTEYVDDIHNSGQHLLGVINDILDLSRAEAGNLELELELLHLPEIVERCLRLVRDKAKQAQVTLLVDPDCVDASIQADSRALKQILSCLLSNGIKFTPAGGTVTVRTRRADQGDLLIAVSDTGIGIEAEDIERILAPFVQADAELSREYEGVGLGLPIAKYLVERHGGDLQIESEPGAGTTVTVRLPADQVVKSHEAA